MQGKKNEETLWNSATAAELVKNRQAIAQLAKSREAQSLMELLQQKGGVQEAAAEAAAGNPAALIGMMEKLMQDQQGAQLVERIQDQAKRAGLDPSK